MAYFTSFVIVVASSGIKTWLVDTQQFISTYVPLSVRLSFIEFRKYNIY